MVSGTVGRWHGSSTPVKGRAATSALPLAALLALAAGGPARADADANGLLQQGPVVSVEQDASGRFQKCTALALVNAGVDRVWQVVTDWGDYEKFMPKVVHSRVIKQEGNIAVVKYELEVPGVNTKYTMRQEMHPDTHTVVSTWVEGDLQGTAWTFRVEPAPDGKTLLSYSGSSRHFSRILESLEDDQQTISVGVNVSAALTTVKALKKRAESH